MDRTNAIRIASSLPTTAKVLDVGGGSAPFPRADYVLDARPFEAGSWQTKKLLEDVIPRRFDKSTWVQRDVCRRDPWPFGDKHFDYVVCSHLLEDIRDPIWACLELQRVSKAGYIEVPSRISEQCLGIEHPKYVGFCHHRWLVDVKDNEIEFRAKAHMIHSFRSAIIAKIGAGKRLNPKYAIQWFEWVAEFSCKEILLLNEEEMAADFVEYARKTRTLPHLVVPRGEPFSKQLRRSIYFARLRLGLL